VVAEAKQCLQRAADAALDDEQRDSYLEHLGTL
jgi:hypothetical protein